MTKFLARVGSTVPTVHSRSRETRVRDHERCDQQMTKMAIGVSAMLLELTGTAHVRIRQLNRRVFYGIASLNCHVVSLDSRRCPSVFDLPGSRTELPSQQLTRKEGGRHELECPAAARGACVQLAFESARQVP